MQSDHPAWEQAKQALSDQDWDRLKNQFDVQSAVEDYLDQEAEIEVKDGAVSYKGEVVHNQVVDRILDFMRQNLPYQPLVKFLGKLMANPSRRATDELYAFLEHKNMPLTPEGNFLAYKGVTSDFKDHYSNKFDNSVGSVLEMRRNGVCDDANMGCSSGFHAGSYEYAKGYASGGGNLMVVEIDPSDVVSVPFDCDCQKLRTAKYKVIAHYETVEAPPLEHELYDDYDEENESWFAGYQQAKADFGIDNE
jgi:DNA/RNA endonuclease YhcR with UshA esterase domain